MFCDNCGTKLKENSNFCPKCGASVTPVDHSGEINRNTQPSLPAANNRKSVLPKVLIVLIAVVGAVLVAAVGVLVYGISAQNNEKNNTEQIQEANEMGQKTVAPHIDTVAVTEAETEAVMVKLDNASGFSGATASSVLGNQAGHSYSAENVLKNDGTCWCEGASDYGEGEWIKLELPEKQMVRGLKIINGYSGTSKQYRSNSKPREIKLEFSDGRSVNVNLTVFSTEKRKSTQNIRFSSPVATEYVKITIVSVEGSEYKDTCLSYVEPY